MGADDALAPKGDGTKCPTCNGPRRLMARCMAANSSCAAGHHWFYCLECRERVVGHSHAPAAKGGLCSRCQAEGWEVEGRG